MKFTLTFLFTLTFISAFCQDIILTNSGKEISSKIIEINLLEVKYKKFEYLDGPIITILKKDILKINYQNGTTETFEFDLSNPFPKVDSTELYSPEKLKLLGFTDAKKYYTGARSGSGGVILTNIVSPILGLIPAIATSATFPNETNLNYQNSDLWKKPEYRLNYIKQSKKIKQKKIWVSWAVSGVTMYIINLIILKSL